MECPNRDMSKMYSPTHFTIINTLVLPWNKYGVVNFHCITICLTLPSGWVTIEEARRKVGTAIFDCSYELQVLKYSNSRTTERILTKFDFEVIPLETTSKSYIAAFIGFCLGTEIALPYRYFCDTIFEYWDQINYMTWSCWILSARETFGRSQV